MTRRVSTPEEQAAGAAPVTDPPPRLTESQIEERRARAADLMPGVVSRARRVKPGRLGLDASEQQWVANKWKLIRRSEMMADAATNDWNRINDEINNLLDRKGIGDVVARARIKSESLALQDAFEVGKWHSANAQRHIDDVLLFLRLKELGLL